MKERKRTSRDDRGPRHASKLLVALAATLGFLAVVEVGFRVAGYDPLGAEDGQPRGAFLRVSDHPLLTYELIPGAEGFGWGTSVAVNSSGFRGPEVAAEKPPGVQRIAVIGDSLTFGNGLAFQDTYPAVMEQVLRREGHAAEVLNLGVGGFDTLEAVAYLEQVGLALEPDVVVLGHCFNDLGTVSLNARYVQDLERFDSWPYRFRLVQWLALRRDRRELTDDLFQLNVESNFVERNRDVIAEIEEDGVQRARQKELATHAPPDREDQRGRKMLAWYLSKNRLGKLRFALERLARIAEENDLQVVVVNVPHLDEGRFQEAFDLAYGIVGHEVERVGFLFLNLAEPVRAADPRGMQRFADDPIHLDARGCALVGRAVAEYLVEAGLVNGG